MIYQSGYLTVKDCDMEFGTFLLDFPNNEVKNGFVSLVASNYLKPEENLNGWIRDVVRALRQGDTESLRGLFTSFLAEASTRSIPRRNRARDVRTASWKRLTMYTSSSSNATVPRTRLWPR